ncbi:MAG: hypothetical protein J7L15_04195 [Clostridiales bacterium]|nr:hypothetical protein [Clostridiales bacterium]
MSLSDYETVYKNLAIHISNAETDESHGDKHMYSALLTIIDLNNTTNDSATSITTFLLDPINRAYEATKVYWHKINQVRIAIQAINNYVSINGGDLDNFVNTISWDGGCVPPDWVLLCEDSNIDTKNWNICI